MGGGEDRRGRVLRRICLSLNTLVIKIHIYLPIMLLDIKDYAIDCIDMGVRRYLLFISKKLLVINILWQYGVFFVVEFDVLF